MNGFSGVRAVVFVGWSAGVGLSPAQENPLQKSVEGVVDGPRKVDARAEVIPLIWKANIGAAITTVPLKSIEHYGIQSYEVDGHARVRELTITLHSRSMIRVYHLLPLGAIHENLAERVEDIRQKLDDDGDEEDLPVKTFPTTTHEKMLEFRVGKRDDIDKLYGSLEASMLTYLARVLVPDQRPGTVIEVSVGGGEE